jgi:hypothetical protein
MDWMSAADREDSLPMPPVLELIALWMLAAAEPFLVELASGPWQLAQLVS